MFLLGNYGPEILACSICGPKNLKNQIVARVAKLVDAPDLGSGALRYGGSTPPSRTSCIVHGVLSGFKRKFILQMQFFHKNPERWPGVLF